MISSNRVKPNARSSSLENRMRNPSRSAALALLVLLFVMVGSRAIAKPVSNEGYVSSMDGVRIHYTLTGHGPIALVFVHGWSCDGTYWKNQVAAFTPHYRVVTLDLAGHGQSGRARKEWTTEAFAHDVQAVVETLGLRKVVLVGHSMSGPICIAASRLMPGRIAAVIGVDTMQDFQLHLTGEQIKPFVGAMQANFRGFVTQFVRGLFPAGADTALVARVAGGMSSAPPDIAIPVFSGIYDYDLKAGIAAANVPIREINSDKYPTNLEGNRQIAKDFKVVVLKGAGHFPQLERPEEFDAALATIVAEVTK